MQFVSIKHIPVNLDPRPGEYSPIPESREKELAYVGRLAQEKRHIASLIVNLYNSNICGADMYHLMSYTRGESCNLLRDGVITLIQCCGAVESHEIYGSEFVEDLIERWGFREDQSDED
ncbi:hypothetical protein [Vibrio diazotrophicus]|uniref:hypothetical protein n=1 Tax=Vibrio diazotrophicus TaxID=685 RepID=UPI0005A70582|nr:hypothetical protein [Vibrio diazotrophicus]